MSTRLEKRNADLKAKSLEWRARVAAYNTQVRLGGAFLFALHFSALFFGLIESVLRYTCGGEHPIGNDITVHSAPMSGSSDNSLMRTLAMCEVAWVAICFLQMLCRKQVSWQQSCLYVVFQLTAIYEAKAKWSDMHGLYQVFFAARMVMMSAGHAAFELQNRRHYIAFKRDERTLTGQLGRATKALVAKRSRRTHVVLAHQKRKIAKQALQRAAENPGSEAKPEEKSLWRWLEHRLAH